jgi:alpha-glucosidase
VYYGDEIGMTDVEVPRGLRRDAMSRDSPHWGGSRDRARTPMPWDGSRSGGFTADGVTPWLPLGDVTRNVTAQRRDTGSVLGLCRALLALRRAELGGEVAGYQPLSAADGRWAYRVGALVVAANFSDAPAEMPREAGELLLSSAQEAPPASRPLGPWEGRISRVRHPLSSRTAGGDAYGRRPLSQVPSYDGEAVA